MKKLIVSTMLSLLVACSGMPVNSANNTNDSSVTQDASVVQDATPDVQPNNCGNSVIDPDEDCDGANLSGESCLSLGWDSGTLFCTNDCTFDESRCIVIGCGNSVLDPGEDCDASNLGGLDCTDYGFFAGSLSCNSNCTVNVSLCEEEPEFCGDGVVQSQESCDCGTDPTNLPAGCTDVNGGVNANCYSDCSGYCGDGLIHNGVLHPDHGEECDGTADCTDVCTITTCGDGYCTPSEGGGNCVEDCGCPGVAVECDGDCCEGLLPNTPGQCCSDNTCVVFIDTNHAGVQNCGTCGNHCPIGSDCIAGTCQ